MAAVRRRGKNNQAEWSRRLAGLMLCVFFALGLWVGASGPGREAAERARQVLVSYRARLKGLVRFGSHAGDMAGAPLDRRNPSPIALAERSDGFYDVMEDGALRGPISPGAGADLPILSGPGVEKANERRLAEYAALTVRAEAILSALVSETRINSDDTASIFLRWPRTELLIDPAAAAVELGHAARVMELWHGHQDLIAALDLTMPGQAVIRLHESEPASRGTGVIRKITDGGHASPGSRLMAHEGGPGWR